MKTTWRKTIHSVAICYHFPDRWYYSTFIEIHHTLITWVLKLDVWLAPFFSLIVTLKPTIHQFTFFSFKFCSLVKKKIHWEEEKKCIIVCLCWKVKALQIIRVDKSVWRLWQSDCIEIYLDFLISNRCLIQWIMTSKTKFFILI